MTEREKAGYRGKVMVVDDDPLVLKLTRVRLEGAGFQVVTRDQALGTAMAVAEEKPDVVILDQNMPALTGEGLAKVLRSRANGTVPIIFHSSEDLSFLQGIARETNALGAIPKTPSDSVFLAQFERLFGRIEK